MLFFLYVIKFKIIIAWSTNIIKKKLLRFPFLRFPLSKKMFFLFLFLFLTFLYVYCSNQFLDPNKKIKNSSAENLKLAIANYIILKYKKILFFKIRFNLPNVFIQSTNIKFSIFYKIRLEIRKSRSSFK